jgi:hypothetical protein
VVVTHGRNCVCDSPQGVSAAGGCLLKFGWLQYCGSCLCSEATAHSWYRVLPGSTTHGAVVQQAVQDTSAPQYCVSPGHMHTCIGSAWGLLSCMLCRDRHHAS